MKINVTSEEAVNLVSAGIEKVNDFVYLGIIAQDSNWEKDN